MKSRSLLVLILILSVAVVPSLQLALAASSASSSTTTSTTTTTSTISAPKAPYSERLDIYTAGYNDYWQVSLAPVDAPRPSIVAAESVPGVTAYELTAVETASASPSSQLFWKDGYGIVRLPFMPTAGAFLNVTASSQSAAQSVASDFNSLLGANFVEIGSSGTNHTYFSPASFSATAAVIFSSVPTVNGGLANMTTASTLSTLPTPIAILTGVSSGSSFTHQVAFGSTETSILANSTLVLTDALGQLNGTFSSSPEATSTQVVVHSLDGLIASNDAAQIVNNVGTFSGTYSFSVPPNSRISPNVTLLQEPPVLTATRVPDRGSAVSGDLVSMTVNLRDTSVSGAAFNVTVSDNWWKAYPSLFALSAGNSSFTIPSMSAGQNVSRVYVLKVTSSTAEDLILPSTRISYSYSVGGLTVNASTTTNQDELRTNNAGPALIVQASSDGESGTPLGSATRYLVTVTNVGDGPALDLKVGNFTNPTLTQGGGVWRFNTTVPLTSIVERNLTKTFALGWTAPDGSTGNLLSNPANVVFSHSGILIPLTRFSLAVALTQTVIKLGSVNATYTVTNAGSHASSGANATQTLPSGVSCKTAFNVTATCTPSGFSVSVGPLAQGADVQGTLLLTFSNDNYLGEPGFVTTTDANLTLHTAGNSFVVPAGVLVTKTYATNQVFEGQNDTVTVHVVNKGSLPVFNLTVTAQSDGFDNAISGTLHQTYGTLSPNSPQSFNYTVKATVAGNHSAAATSAAFTFGGSAQSYTYASGSLLVYKTIAATTSTTPSAPVEGSDFLLAVNLQNPSTVNVTNISVRIQIPPGITIVNSSSGVVVNGHTLTFSLPSLAAGATSTSSVFLKAASDGNVNLGSGTLTFQYLGQTLSGVVLNNPIAVGADLLVRYELPIGLAALLTVAVAIYMHRKLTPTQAKGPRSG
jgi:Translocon-associated protein beta (TRAPB)